MLSFVLATEDALSEAVGRRLIREHSNAVVGLPLRENGFGYLRRSIGKFTQLARTSPILLLTDLDRKPCPGAMIREWVGDNPLPSEFLFRVVVRSVESWIMADAVEFAAFLCVSAARIPRDPETLLDPKRSLLQVALRANRDVRADIVRQRGENLTPGTGYNTRLTSLVASQWCPDRAAQRSPSLDRARRRLAAAVARLSVEHP